MITEEQLTKLGASMATSLTKQLGDLAKATATDARDRLKLALGTAFSSYVDRSAKRFSHIKTLVDLTTPYFLYDVYVPQDITHSDHQIHGVSARDIYLLPHPALIVAPGGSGKSVLSRHLFIDCAASGVGIPLLVELRKLNKDNPDLLSTMYDTLDVFGDDVSLPIIERAFAKGLFFVILDGLDEVPHAIRASVQNQINELIDRFPTCQVVMTTRPDSGLDTWERFLLFRVNPFGLEQVRQFIATVPFKDEEKKIRFMTAVENELIQTHQSFLQNPLLLSMLLLTFSDFSDVPTKQSLFYSQVFDTLWSRHDARKDGDWKRDRYCLLDMDDFKRLFAACSCKLYLKDEYRFTRESAVDAIEYACRSTGVEEQSDNVIKDLITSTCLWTQESNEFTYAHRSFQEFFTSMFCASIGEEAALKISPYLFERGQQDVVFGLLHEIAPEIVEETILIPSIQQLFSTINWTPGSPVADDVYLRYLDQIVQEFTLGGYEVRWLRNARNGGLVDVCNFMYGRISGHLIIDISDLPAETELIKRPNSLAAQESVQEEELHESSLDETDGLVLPHLNEQQSKQWKARRDEWTDPVQNEKQVEEFRRFVLESPAELIEAVLLPFPHLSRRILPGLSALLDTLVARGAERKSSIDSLLDSI